MSEAGRRRSMPGPARFAIAGVALLALAFVAGIGGALLSDQPGPGGVVATAALITVTMAAALGGGVWWWARLDEAAREAHKWAWWWGGSVGMALGGVLLLTVATHGDTAAVSAWIGDTPADAFGAGIVAILLFQLVGYTVAWALWWLRRR